MQPDNDHTSAREFSSCEDLDDIAPPSQMFQESSAEDTTSAIGNDGNSDVEPDEDREMVGLYLCHENVIEYKLSVLQGGFWSYLSSFLKALSLVIYDESRKCTFRKVQ